MSKKKKGRAFSVQGALALLTVCCCHDSKDTSVVMTAGSLPLGPGDSAEQAWGAEADDFRWQPTSSGLTPEGLDFLRLCDMVRRP